ncbi:MAG: metallophosphoesterase [Candidatus Diapherotrites archaeon]|uniref:DNA polymerase II small subunit n=1 Tax=Candidatus Iainarchaeum sp. TaxID=3101447 RepID=A0A8T3YL49_9ARCH|nr:metallophosphoesterase [Candidatus Diapherotrites archaeon]
MPSKTGALLGSKSKEIIEFCSSREQLIDRESLELLSAEEHWKQVLEQISSPMVTAKEVKQCLVKHNSKLGEMMMETVVKRGSFTATAKETAGRFRVMKELEAGGKGASEGKLKDFKEYFMDKYTFLSSLLSHRTGFAPKTFDRLKDLPKYAEADIIGMVMKKWVSKNGNTTIEVDSPDGRCIVIVSKEDLETNRDADRILLDDVIGVKGKKFSDEVIIAKRFLWPDIMQRTPKNADTDLSAALISDIHVGSKLFMEKEFSRFIAWLNGSVASESEKRHMGKIKYLFIAGDNVDGVGIYPEQFDELEIKDVYAQYDRLSELILQIPEYIEIFIAPGQHDAVRRADPQPAIQHEFVKGISSAGNVHFIGSPGWVEAEGLKFMVYHGASMHDMIAATKHLKYTEPEKAMIELLRRRDLSTGFGLTQPYVPERHDYMVIREEPDFYFGGDMHIKGYAQYRGCLVANAGCWQSRTDFQVKQGLQPTPGICIDINLKTRKLTENNFARSGNDGADSG